MEGDSEEDWVEVVKAEEAMEEGCGSSSELESALKNASANKSVDATLVREAVLKLSKLEMSRGAAASAPAVAEGPSSNPVGASIGHHGLVQGKNASGNWNEAGESQYDRPADFDELVARHEMEPWLEVGTPGRAVAGAEATTSSPFSVGSAGSSMAVSFAQDLAADVFSSADPSFLDAATLRADRASERAARDALERASSGEIQLQAIELEGRVRELGDAKGALQAVSVHVVARHREAEELKLRIAATEQQRAAVAKEHEWCLRRLASLRGQCESYAGTLREKQHELHSATQELEALAREVTAVQTRMASQLDEAHALNRALITAREEVRALKQSQALLLQQAHVESKQVAPLHLELSQLTAEIGVLQQQIDATVANDLSADGRPTAPAVEYRELQQQVGEARRQLLEEELMGTRSNRTKQKASVESTRSDAMRRELGALQVESARARQAATAETALRTTPTTSKLSLLDDTLMVQGARPPTAAPAAHDAGIEYGVLAADIAADNMAAHIAAAADSELPSEVTLFAPPVTAAGPPVNAANFVPSPALSGYAPPPALGTALGGRAPPPAPASAAFSRQPPVSFSPAAGSPDTGLSHLSSAWSAQSPGPPTHEQSFKAQPFRPPPFTPSVDPKRAWRGAEIGLVELSRPAERPAEPSSKPEKPTQRRRDKAPKQVGVLAFQSSNGHSSLHASAHHGTLPPHRWVSSPSSRLQATAARSATCRHWTVAARLRLRSTRFCRPPPHYRPHHR